jgi:hypothetical protein
MYLESCVFPLRPAGAFTRESSKPRANLAETSQVFDINAFILEAIAMTIVSADTCPDTVNARTGVPDTPGCDPFAGWRIM